MTLASLQTAFPDFVPNQVLTDAQLNQLRDYLDGQTRLGRLRTAGQGIACGLTVSRTTVASEPAVRVEGGYGLTSDGYLVELGADETAAALAFEPTVYTRVVDYTDPVTMPADGGGTTDVPVYEPWRNGTEDGQLPLLRLLTADETLGDDEGTPRPIDADEDLDGHVVVLYLERAPETLDGCFVTTCDNRGRRVQHAVRALLVDASQIAPAPERDAVDPPPPRARVPRLHTVLDAPEKGLAQVGSRDDLVDAFQAAVEIGVERVTEALEKTLGRYAAPLDLDEDTADELIAQIGQLLGRFEDGPALAYDHLRHLADAVAAFGQAACEAVGGCAFESGYGRHLLLGHLDGVGHPSDGGEYRHAFLPAPTIHAPALARARRAFRRLVTMAATYEPKRPQQLERVVATASQTARWPLGARAVPAYYDAEALAADWREAPCDGEPVRSAGTEVGTETEDGGLDAVYADASLVRLEGHIGQAAGDMVSEIERLRAARQLEVSLVVTYFEKEPDVDGAVGFSAFADAHPGLEPVGGVEPGGTFVLVTEDNEVVADFALRCCAGRAPAEAPQDTATLVVTVEDDANEPVVGAQVWLSRGVGAGAQVEDKAWTDGTGTARFAEIALGTVSLLVTKSGYEDASPGPVTLKAGSQTLPVTIEEESGVGFLQIIGCPRGEVPPSALIDGEKEVPLENGGTTWLELVAGEHEVGIAVNRALWARFGEPQFDLTWNGPIAVGELTTLFVTRDSEGGLVLAQWTSPVLTDIPDDTVAVAIYHNAFGTGPLAVIPKSSPPISSTLEAGQRADYQPVPAEDDQISVHGVVANTVETYSFPVGSLGGQFLDLLVCDGAVYYVRPDGPAMAAPRIGGGGPKYLPGEDDDVVIGMEPSAKNALNLRQLTRLQALEAAVEAYDIDSDAEKAALAFIETTSTRTDVPPRDLTKDYEAAVALLEERIDNTTDRLRGTYRDLLEGVTHSYLDRVARYAEGGGVAVEAVVNRIPTTLAKNGLNLEGVRSRWKADELGEILGDAGKLPSF